MKIKREILFNQNNTSDYLNYEIFISSQFKSEVFRKFKSQVESQPKIQNPTTTQISLGIRRAHSAR